MLNQPAQAFTRPARGFTSDNIAGISPEVMQALVECSTGQAMPYGNDEITQRLEKQVSEVFEKDAKVFLVSTGSAANALSLAAMTPPWGSVLAHSDAHINRDECGAPEFFTDGAKLIMMGGENGKVDLDVLRSQAKRMVGDVHSVQPSSVSITQATEVGSVYTLDEIEEIGAVCRDAKLGFHMDGARFANAVAHLRCSPAEMTWKRGVDVLSFGATKNGTFGVDAIILFNHELAQQLAFRRKRAGQLSSKMRFFSAQMEAYLADALWMRNAAKANEMAHALATGLANVPGAEVQHQPEANILFCKLSPAQIDGLLAEGFRFYHDRWAPGTVRFVTSFATSKADVDDLVSVARRISSTM